MQQGRDDTSLMQIAEKEKQDDIEAEHESISGRVKDAWRKIVVAIAMAANSGSGGGGSSDSMAMVGVDEENR